jgi:hypothetical protein
MFQVEISKLLLGLLLSYLYLTRVCLVKPPVMKMKRKAMDEGNINKLKISFPRRAAAF